MFQSQDPFGILQSIMPVLQNIYGNMGMTGGSFPMGGQTIVQAPPQMIPDFMNSPAVQRLNTLNGNFGAMPQFPAQPGSMFPNPFPQGTFGAGFPGGPWGGALIFPETPGGMNTGTTMPGMMQGMPQGMDMSAMQQMPQGMMMPQGMGMPSGMPQGMQAGMPQGMMMPQQGMPGVMPQGMGQSVMSGMPQGMNLGGMNMGGMQMPTVLPGVMPGMASMPNGQAGMAAPHGATLQGGPGGMNTNLMFNPVIIQHQRNSLPLGSRGGLYSTMNAGANLNVSGPGVMRAF